MARDRAEEYDRSTVARTVHVGAIAVVCLFGLAGIRFIATFRHNNDLAFMFPALSRLASTRDEVPGLDTEADDVNGDPQYAPPALALTIGIVCALFAVVVLLVPSGVGLATSIHL